VVSINRATLIGNVVKDPEFRTTHDGREVCNFIFATEELWKDKETGELKQKSEWHRITCFNPLILDKIRIRDIHKGDLLWIEGQIQTRKWKDQNGQEKASTEIVLHGHDAKLHKLNTEEKTKYVN
jgi:single-strand DNA-binding protein